MLVPLSSQPDQPGLQPLRQRLTTVHFDVVGGCQLRCVGCPNSGLDPKPEFISSELFARCLENIDVQKVTLFRLFNYGEPLLHPKLAELGRILKDSALKMHWVEISTNAQCKAEDTLEALAAMGLVNILTISCDGDGTPARYEALRPPARWSRLMSFLSFARDLAARYPRLHLQARCVIETPEDALRWREVLKPYGVNPQFRGWLQLPDSLRDKEQETVPMGQGGCAIASDPNSLYVDHRGNVVPCCFHPGAAFLGNLGEHRYSTLFSSARRTEFLDALKTRRASMPICNRCDVGAGMTDNPSTEAVMRFQQKGR